MSSEVVEKNKPLEVKESSSDSKPLEEVKEEDTKPETPNEESEENEKPAPRPQTSLKDPKTENETSLKDMKKKVLNITDLKKPLIDEKRWRYFRYGISLDHHFSPPKEAFSSFVAPFWEEFRKIQDQFRPIPIERIRRKDAYLSLRDKVQKAMSQPLTEEEEGFSSDQDIFVTRPNLVVLLGKIQYCVGVEEEIDYYGSIFNRRIRVDLTISGEEDHIGVKMKTLHKNLEVKFEESEVGKISVSIGEPDGEKVYPYIQGLEYNDEYEVSMRKVLDDRKVRNRFTRFLRGGYMKIIRSNHKFIMKYKSKKLEEEEEEEGEEDSENTSMKETWPEEIAHVPQLVLLSLYHRAVVNGKRGKFSRSRNEFRIVRQHRSRYSYLGQLCTMNIAVTYVIQKKYSLGFELLKRLFEFVKFKVPKERRHNRHNRMLSAIYYRLSMLYAFYKVDYHRAIELIEESQEIEPTTRNLFIRSEYHYLIKEYQKSIEDLEEVARYTYRERDLDDIRYNISISYFFAFKNEKALENFDKIKNERQIRKIYLYKGLCYFDLHRYEEALEYFERGLVTIRMFLRRSEKDRKKSPVEKAIEKHWRRDFNLIVSYLCETLMKLGRVKESLEFLKEFKGPSVQVINTLLLLKLPEKAKEICEKYLEKTPNDNSVREHLALALLRMKDHEEAKKVHSELISRKYRIGHNMYNRGVCYLRQHKYDAAMKDFNEAIETHKLKVYLNRGICKVLMGKYEEGIQDFDREIRTRSSSFQAYFEKGNTYYLMRKYQKSIDVFDHIVLNVLKGSTKSQEYLQSVYAKAIILKAMGSPSLRRIQEKIDLLESSKKKNNNNNNIMMEQDEKNDNSNDDKKKKDKENEKEKDGEVVLIKTVRVYRFGDPECYHESVKIFDELVSREYKQDLCLVNRGYCFLQLKKYELALQDSDFVIEKYGTSGGYFNRGLVLKITGRFEEAIEMFKVVVEKVPDDYETRFEMSECCYHLKRLSEARDLLYGVVKAIPGHAPGHHNLGYILYLQRDYEGAVTHFEKSVHLNYHFKYLFYHYGLALYSLRRFEEAAQKFKNQLDPEFGIENDPLSIFQLGCCLLNTQKYDEAIKMYCVVIRFNPKHFLAYVNRGMCYGFNKQHKLAIQDYTIALSLRQNDPYTLKRRGNEYLKSGKYREAYFDYCEFCKFYNLQQEKIKNLSKSKNMETKLSSQSTTTTTPSSSSSSDEKEEEESLKTKKNEERSEGSEKEEEEDPTTTTKKEEVLMVVVANENEKEEEEVKVNDDDDDGKVEEEEEEENSILSIAEGINDLEVLFRMGICEYELGLVRKAIKTFDAILKTNPQEILCHYEKGIIYYGQHENEKALECYTKVLEQVPDHLDSLNNRGLCFLRIKDYPSALKDFKECVKYSQNRYYKANFNKGIILRHLAKYREAIIAFTAALIVNPSYLQAYWERANVYMDVGNWMDAKEDLSKCIELSDTNMVFLQLCLYHRGICLVKLLNIVEAIQDYEHILQLNPNHSLAIFERGYCNLTLKYYDKALEDFTAFLKLTPNSVQGLSNRGICNYKLREYEKAMKDFLLLLAKNPSNHTALFYMGCCFLELYEDMKAIKYFTECIKVNPNYDLSYFNRGICYESAGKIEEAFRDFETAYMMNKKNKEALARRNKMELEIAKKSQTPPSVLSSGSNQNVVGNSLTSNSSSSSSNINNTNSNMTSQMQNLSDGDSEDEAANADAAACGGMDSAAGGMDEDPDEVADAEASMYNMDHNDDDAAGGNDAAAASGM